MIEIIHKTMHLTPKTHSILKLLCTYTQGFIVRLVSDINRESGDQAVKVDEHLLLALKLKKKSVFTLELDSELEYSSLVRLHLR